jgi:DNA mismatch repair ATPase MutS
MQYFFYGLIVILILVLWSIWYEKKNEKNLKERLKREWKEVPNQEYTSEKLKSLQAYYKTVKDDVLDVDDITWNDLDMDELFMLMNNTQSAMGEEYLYAMLRKPCQSDEELNERNRLIEFFRTHEDERLKLQVKLKHVGKLMNISAFEYANCLGEEKADSNIPHILMGLGFISSVVLIFFNPVLGGIGTFLFFIINTFSYYAYKSKIDKYLTVCSFIIRMLNKAQSIKDMHIPEIKAYTDLMSNDIKAFGNFKRGSRIVVSENATGNVMDAFIDYLRMLTHVDLIKYNNMQSFFKKNRQILNRIFTTMGFLDSMIAAASFRDMLPYYATPELTKSGKPFLSGTDLYHPLIGDPVPNSISEKRSVLITGSNASGKSTFIKTLATNAILSQTIYTSTAREYKSSFFIIYTSMALRDNIFSSESYFIVEIKSLKRIMDRSKSDIPVLCFIDEVLRGTNTQERIAASSIILYTLAKRNTLCFAATHDIELTHILEDHVSNYHFSEHISENKVLFDYRLHKGRATSRNAIKLLGILGYSQDLVDIAEAFAKDFSEHGEWKKIN